MEAKAILVLYRPGVDDAKDPLFAEALRLAENDAELAVWLAAEQRRDDLIAAKLENAAEVPIGLKNAVLAENARVRPSSKSSWHTGYFFRYALPLGLMLAAIVLFFAKPKDANPIADFRAEMVGFLRLPPTLELKTHDLSEVTNWLQTSEGFTQVAFPAKTRQQQLAGCRTLVFHGQKVALICFLRKDHQLIHLLVLSRDAFPHADITDTPQFVQQGEWMTATWIDAGMVYMLTTKGDHLALEQYLDSI